MLTAAFVIPNLLKKPLQVIRRGARYYFIRKRIEKKIKEPGASPCVCRF
jgi:hypothetical protein